MKRYQVAVKTTKSMTWDLIKGYDHYDEAIRMCNIYKKRITGRRMRYSIFDHQKGKPDKYKLEPNTMYLMQTKSIHNDKWIPITKYKNRMIAINAVIDENKHHAEGTAIHRIIDIGTGDIAYSCGYINNEKFN